MLAYANAISLAGLLGVVGFPQTDADQRGWAATWLTGVGFGVWGPALTAATMSYHRRTRQPAASARHTA